MNAALASFILAALCVVAITVLAALSVPIPDVLPTVALVSVGGGAGLAAPAKRTTSRAAA